MKRTYIAEYFNTRAESWRRYSYTDEPLDNFKAYVIGLEGGNKMRLVEKSGTMSRVVRFLDVVDNKIFKDVEECR